MKRLSTPIALFLCAAALTVSGCVTHPAAKPQARWVKIDGEVPAPKVPRGIWRQTDDGGVLTLPNGEKFVSKNLPDQGEVRLTFPNGQTFSSETAKTDFHPPFVSDDDTLVAIERIPATKSGDLHLYIKGHHGQFRELANVNGQVDKLLREAYQNAGGDVLRLRALKGHTLTLWTIDYRSSDFLRFEFKLHVAPNGTLSLVK